MEIFGHNRKDHRLATAPIDASFIKRSHKEKPSHGWVAYRRIPVVLMHLILFASSFLLAIALRFDFVVPQSVGENLAVWIPLVLGAKLAVFFALGQFHGLWRHVGVQDLWSLGWAQTLSLGALACILWAVSGPVLPRSIWAIDWLVGFAWIGGLRFGIRFIREVEAQIQSKSKIEGKSQSKSQSKEQLLVVGAGSAGETLVRDLLRAGRSVLGILDDDVRLHGGLLHGVPVLGGVDAVEGVAASARYGALEILIAVPSASGDQMRRILTLCARTECGVRIIPGISNLTQGISTMMQARKVEIADVLGRKQAAWDDDGLRGFFLGKTVLVTGAGGSIGSELCRRLVGCAPDKIVLLDRCESSLNAALESLVLPQDSNVEIEPCLSDVLDADRMESVFERLRPDLVLHASAHKHVPMLQQDPVAAVHNNVLATYALLQCARRFEVGLFLLVSTDKAVQPTSVMGASKRAAEFIMDAVLAEQPQGMGHSAVAHKTAHKTICATVRFGNVLDSTGSVLPRFRKQIRKGGPVTVTHPKMQRYFMTIPEAALLILEAASRAQGGELFVLDMGKPVSILQLAEDLIRLHGLKPHDEIPIVYSGIRAGEKLHESWATKEEDLISTDHDKILQGKIASLETPDLKDLFFELEASVAHQSAKQALNALRSIAPDLDASVGDGFFRADADSVEKIDLGPAMEIYA